MGAVLGKIVRLDLYRMQLVTLPGLWRTLNPSQSPRCFRHACH
jgi:hypothetical protein